MKQLNAQLNYTRFTGTLGAFDIHKATNHGHHMANLRCVLPTASIAETV